MYAFFKNLSTGIFESFLKTSQFLKSTLIDIIIIRVLENKK